MRCDLTGCGGTVSGADSGRGGELHMRSRMIRMFGVGFLYWMLLDGQIERGRIVLARGDKNTRAFRPGLTFPSSLMDWDCVRLMNLYLNVSHVHDTGGNQYLYLLCKRA